MNHHVSSLDGRKYPARYFEGLSPALKRARERELARRRDSKAPKMGASDRAFLASGKAKKSSWTARFRAIYPDVPADLPVLARSFGVPIQNLQEVFDKGLAAWQTSGSRPGANAFQWAWARAYKFLLIHAGHARMKPRDPDAYLHVRR
jgi:hypothetical protein